MGRVISSGLADVVEQLELDGELVVTITSLRAAMEAAGRRETSDTQVRSTAYRLQRAGWLATLRPRGAWEFLPAARAGRFRAGDRHMELRAYAATHPGWPGVLAMDSAATLHGLAQRFPSREVIALPRATAPPKAFARQWRIITTALPAATSTTMVNGLAVWTLEALLVGIAERPTNYGDPAGLAQWLPEAAARADVTLLLTLLAGLPGPVRQRAAYLVGAVGDGEGRDRILGPLARRSVVWFGPRGRGGTFDAATSVNDTLLRPHLTEGVGA